MNEQFPKSENFLQNIDVSSVFEMNPELANIGSKEQYAQYLKSIFPETKVNEIMWHGSLNDITGNFKHNQHFGSREAAEARNNFKKQVIADMNKQEYYYPAILNIKNLKRVDDADYAWDKEIEVAKAEGFDGLVYTNNNEGKNNDSYVIFQPEQIHVLGQAIDLDKFNAFVG